MYQSVASTVLYDGSSDFSGIILGIKPFLMCFANPKRMRLAASYLPLPIPNPAAR